MMDRRERILKYAGKKLRGIEIGPWFNPMAPKREGYNCLVMDVFDSQALRARAQADPLVASRVSEIEAVDLVGSSTEIDDVVAKEYPLGSFDYVVSSHNFEHLPDPVRFLRACSRVLKAGGIVSMAIPDHRWCFDFFRPVTTLPEWLDAFMAKRMRPTPLQSFQQDAFFAHVKEGASTPAGVCHLTPPQEIAGPANLKAIYAEFMRRSAQSSHEYVDAHCWFFTPASFELLMLDCAYLGLLDFELIEVVPSDSEFYVHLRALGHPGIIDDEEHRQRRDRLLHCVRNEEAEASIRFQSLMREHAALRQSDAARQALEAASLRAEVASLRSQLLEAQSKVDEFRASRSWKVTAPLRWAAGKARSGRGRAPGRA